MKLIFNNIEEEIIKHLRESDNIYGNMAWFTNTKLLEELKRMKWFRISMNDDYINNMAISKYEEVASFVNLYSPYAVKAQFLLSKDKMIHNKIMVLRKGLKIYCVISGSYNWTNKANLNFENITISYDEDINKQYLQEIKRINKLCMFKSIS